MPWVLCCCCKSWSLRDAWAGVGHGFPFRIRCPACLSVSDVSDTQMRLWRPEGSQEEQRVIALALRVHAVVAGLSTEPAT